MRNISVKTDKDDHFIKQMNALYSTFKNIENGEKINFDLGETNWICPILLLPMASYIKKTGSSYVRNSNKITNGYLDAVSFPEGVRSVTSFEKMARTNKSYTPISVLDKSKNSEREDLESLFTTMIYDLLGSVPGAKNVVYQPIGELVTNIFEHSGDDLGFVFGQYYPKKEFLDICIVDMGKGLVNTYKEKGILVSDDEAIIKVLEGHSTKSDKERGFGVRTSKEIVCKCLDGCFTIISGSYALLASKDNEKLVKLPDFHWQGVIVGYRINKPKGAVDITPYLE
jgi:hypothetical protein